MLILQMNRPQSSPRKSSRPGWRTVSCPANAALNQNACEVAEERVTHPSGWDGKTRGASIRSGLQGWKAHAEEEGYSRDMPRQAAKAQVKFSLVWGLRV